MSIKNLIDKKWFLRITLPVIAVSIAGACVVSFAVIKTQYSSVCSLTSKFEGKSRTLGAYELADICEKMRSNEVYSDLYYKLENRGIGMPFSKIQKDFYPDYVAVSDYIKLFCRFENKERTKEALNLYVNSATEYFNKFAKENNYKYTMVVNEQPSEPTMINNSKFQYLVGITLAGTTLGLIAGGYVTYLIAEKEKKDAKK